MLDKRYSIRLADGKEQTFDSASEMAKWVAEQKSYDLANRNRTRKRAPRKSRRKPASKARCYSGDAPLARYANRNSNET